MNMKLRISKKPFKNADMNCKQITMREKVLKWLLGDKIKMMIIVPSEYVDELEIIKKAH